MMCFMSSGTRSVIALAQANDGIVPRGALRDAGVTRHVQRRLVRDGVLRPVTGAVFALGDAPLSWSQQLRVALAHAGPEAAISHASAAAWWSLPRIGPGAVEVTIPRRGRPPARPLGRIHRSRDLGPGATVRLADLPVTTPCRTLFDMACRWRPTLLDECAQDFARRGLVTAEALHAELDARRRSGLAGVARMEALLDAIDLLPEADSWLEARFALLVRDHGLPEPETPVWFEVDGHRYRVDALWRAARLIVELKGYGTHATRRELADDAEREARLGSLGYEVLTFTRDQVVDSPRFVVAQLAQRVGRTGRPVRSAAA